MKILLAVDGSKHAMAATKKCCEIIAMDEKTEIRILAVADIPVFAGTEPFGISSEFNARITDQSSKMAEQFADEAKTVVIEKLGQDAKVETKVLRGSPKVEIVEEAEKWEADLVVVGSHGYGFFERMLIGSVSNAILHHAPCSVLIVKSEETDES